MLERYSIRTQILVAFITIATIAMVLISTVAIGNVNSVGDSTQDQASDALEDQIIRNIGLSSQENAAIIENKFRNAEASVHKIVEATQSIFDPDVTIEERESYSDELTETTLPDAGLDAEYGETISLTTSTHYIPDTYLENNRPTSDMNQTIGISANLDGLFSSIYSQNPEYVWLYIAFSNGVFRNYPGAHVDPLDKEYDPPNEDWYVETLDARGDLVYSPPYFDITQGLVISLTQGIYIDGTFIGVVGLDFKLTTIRDKVLDVNFLESGYASLFETDTLTVVSHPEWDADSHDIDEDIPTIDEIEGVTALTPSILSTITSGDANVTEYTRDEEEYFLSYAPLLVSGDGSLYTFTISVKKSEVLQPVDNIQDQINSSLGSIRISTILVGIIVLVATLFAGLWIATNITQPVAKLTQIAEQITKNTTKDDIFESVVFDEDLQSDDEIGDLTRSFSQMVKTLREEQNQKKVKK